MPRRSEARKKSHCSNDPESIPRGGQKRTYQAMKRAIAYAALASELETWRDLPQAELLSALRHPPASRVVEVDGGELVLEVVVSWANERRKAVKIAATAYGPSHLLLERLEETLTVPFSP